MLPQELRGSYTHLIHEDDMEVLPVLKAADKLSAHIKCLEEQKGGNTDFDSAAAQTYTAMQAMGREELDWFLEHCLPAFSLDLDQL
jgi:5'-deoxynucleotidase